MVIRTVRVAWMSDSRNTISEPMPAAVVRSFPALTVIRVGLASAAPSMCRRTSAIFSRLCELQLDPLADGARSRSGPPRRGRIAVDRGEWLMFGAASAKQMRLGPRAGGSNRRDSVVLGGRRAARSLGRQIVMRRGCRIERLRRGHGRGRIVM